MSIVNVYGVYYDACRTDGEENVKELLADIEKLPIKMIKNIDKEVIIKAARFKVDFSISLADSIALGLGKELGAKVVTADHHEFDKIEEKSQRIFTGFDRKLSFFAFACFLSFRNTEYYKRLENQEFQGGFSDLVVFLAILFIPFSSPNFYQTQYFISIFSIVGFISKNVQGMGSSFNKGDSPNVC